MNESEIKDHIGAYVTCIDGPLRSIQTSPVSFDHEKASNAFLSMMSVPYDTSVLTRYMIEMVSYMIGCSGPTTTLKNLDLT